MRLADYLLSCVGARPKAGPAAGENSSLRDPTYRFLPKDSIGGQSMASPGISPGMKGQKQTFVCEHNVAPHVAKFSTPSMIQLMEQASSEVVGGNLQDGELSVGIEVNIRHLAAADIGATIIAHAELIEIDRNRLT
ncbi:uncharacterized protein METZ01_LOCUS353908, partial [marine metagenome]